MSNKQKELTAELAREMYNQPYTLNEILCHIKSRAHQSHSVHGYKSTRLNHEVRDALERLGYTVGFSKHQTFEANVRSHMATDICISWDEAEDAVPKNSDDVIAVNIDVDNLTLK